MILCVWGGIAGGALLTTTSAQIAEKGESG